jgi:hypothetical protein
MECLKIYRKDIDFFIIEFIPDTYITEQPINELEYIEKLPKFADIIKNLNDYTRNNRLRQIIVIDCDKCVNILKFNFVYFVRIVKYLGKKYKDTDLLEEVQIIHSNQMIQTIYNTMSRLIPKAIFELIKLY